MIYFRKKIFLQTHKSYIISKSKVEAIVGNQILIEDHKIPIARSFKEQVLESLVSDKILKKVSMCLDFSKEKRGAAPY